MTNKQIRPRISEREYSALLATRLSKNVGIIGDTHAPFTHPGYLDFCSDVFDRFNCSTIVHIGDEVDNHAVSYHDPSLDAKSPSDEGAAAQKELDRWYERFPSVMVCIGNHSAIPERKFRSSGIPKRFLKDYQEAWNAPECWYWRNSWVVDGVKYTHGTRNGGMYAHINMAKANFKSVVIGHNHSYGSCIYRAHDDGGYFGLNVGCGIDVEAYAFEYGIDYQSRPTIGCGVVLDSGRMGVFVPMKLGGKQQQ